MERKKKTRMHQKKFRLTIFIPKLTPRQGLLTECSVIQLSQPGKLNRLFKLILQKNNSGGRLPE